MLDVFCSHCGIKMRRNKNKDIDYKEAYQCVDSCGAITYIARKLPKIKSIYFALDGETYVYDENDNLIPEYQNTHAETIRLLNLDGIDYKTITITREKKL